MWRRNHRRRRDHRRSVTRNGNRARPGHPAGHVRPAGVRPTNQCDLVDDVRSLSKSAPPAPTAGTAGDRRSPPSPTQIGPPITDDDESVTAVAFSADGATLATASRHGHTRLWNVAYLVGETFSSYSRIPRVVQKHIWPANVRADPQVCRVQSGRCVVRCDNHVGRESASRAVTPERVQQLRRRSGRASRCG